MILKEIAAEVPQAERPLVKILKHTNDLKVIAIGLRSGLTWPDHKTPVTAKLFVLQGTVVYQESGKEVQLDQYEEMEIEIGVTHSLKAVADSLCLLIQG